MSGPRAQEHLERMVAMSKDGGQTWDLSPNAQATITWAAAELRRLAGVESELQQARARVAELETGVKAALYAYVYAYRAWDRDECESAKFANVLGAIADPLRAALTPKPEAGR